jgi:rod shape-determining protein MreC
MPRSTKDIIVLLVLLAVGLIAVFSYASEEREAGLLGRMVYGVIRPVQGVVRGARDRVADAWNGYIALMGVREENVQLKAEIDQLRQAQAALRAKERENRRLRKLLDLKSRYDLPSLAAQVIGEDATGWYRSFFINRGSADGLRPGMAVTVGGGVVGKVSTTSPTMAKVMLLTDPAISVDCRVARTRDRGLVSGRLQHGCILRYIDLASDAREGDEVVTSGLGGIFPRGLVVGNISTLRQDAHGLFLEAVIVPAVDFAKVEEVLVVLAQRGGFDMPQALERVR